MTITPSPDQTAALTVLHDRLDTGARSATLGGLAGCGKTSLAQHLAESLDGSVTCLAPTGKAAHNFKKRTGIPCSTIHKAIYNPYEWRDPDDATRKELRFSYDPNGLDATDYVIIDEASMVSKMIHGDLHKSMRRHGFQTIYIGDHGQLPPVADSFGFMDSPDARLETIHRQAADNPLILLAHAMRSSDRKARRPRTEGTDELGYSVLYEKDAGDLDVLSYDVVICATNATRTALNKSIRIEMEHQGPLVPDERIIILRNDPHYTCFNGQEARVHSIDELGRHTTTCTLHFDGEDAPRPVKLWMGHFGRKPRFIPSLDDELVIADYAYAITGHKSQGSQWDRVLVMEEPVDIPNWDWTRWTYTAITRATSHVTLVVP